MRGYADLPLPEPGLDQRACKRIEDGGSVPQFLRALLEHLPAARRPSLCTAMTHHFAERFATAGQGVCP